MNIIYFSLVLLVLLHSFELNAYVSKPLKATDLHINTENQSMKKLKHTLTETKNQSKFFLFYAF